jgi:hypothetical protein
MRQLSLAAAAAALVGLGLTAVPPAPAQLSPNCLRNGRRDYCAITPIAGATTEQQAFDMVTFADHTVYEVLRNETSCRQIAEGVRTCNAKIITPPGNPRPIPAYYRGTRYEGGYRHEYVGRGVHITYVFLD